MKGIHYAADGQVLHEDFSGGWMRRYCRQHSALDVTITPLPEKAARLKVYFYNGTTIEDTWGSERVLCAALTLWLSLRGCTLYIEDLKGNRKHMGTVTRRNAYLVTFSTI